MKDRMCQYGNCLNETAAITINYYDRERPAFCCAVHAAAWLLQQEGYEERSLIEKAKAMIRS